VKDTLQQYFNSNKSLWNKRAEVHFYSDFYNVKDFKEGKSSLNKIEIDELGDVIGKTLLHLQCHFGMDTISWSRNGAIATGLDFSESAINIARDLARELNQDVRFICCNVYDAKVHLNEKFDIIYTSYGTIGWLPDLQKWADVISGLLKPGGRFYIVDFHPMVWMFDEKFDYFKYSYFNNGHPIIEENSGTYAVKDASLQDKEYGWNHSISEIIGSLLSSGLKLLFFNEHSYSPYNCFSNMIETEKGKWKIRNLEDKIPALFSLAATWRILFAAIFLTLIQE
jgi:SAM-dependent methyltransferase